MKYKDDGTLETLIDALNRRDEALREGTSSIGKYNKYNEIMVQAAHKLLEKERQDELLPYLKSSSVSIQKDVACILFNIYPERCTLVLQKIAKMTTASGLPVCYARLPGSAKSSLNSGIPKDFP